jgi:hypothetical protein
MSDFMRVSLTLFLVAATGLVPSASPAETAGPPEEMSKPRVLGHIPTLTQAGFIAARDDLCPRTRLEPPVPR